MKPKAVEQDQDFFEEMEGRYGPAFVQDIQDHVQACKGQEIQYLEMKQMVDILARFRTRVRLMIREYRRWKADYERETDEIEKVYKAYDGIFLRRRLGDAWQMYATVNRDYHEMYRTYLARLRQVPHWYEAA